MGKIQIADRFDDYLYEHMFGPKSKRVEVIKDRDKAILERCKEKIREDLGIPKDLERWHLDDWNIEDIDTSINSVMEELK